VSAPITDTEQRLFESAIDFIIDNPQQITLMRGDLSFGTDEVPVCIIGAIVERGDTTGMAPLALMISDDIFDRLTPAGGSNEVGELPFEIADASTLLDEAIGRGLLDTETLATLMGLPIVHRAEVVGSKVRLWTQEDGT
jgi:hypothetical protein